jgi:hypothetical protein
MGRLARLVIHAGGRTHLCLDGHAQVHYTRLKAALEIPLCHNSLRPHVADLTEQAPVVMLVCVSPEMYARTNQSTPWHASFTSAVVASSSCCSRVFTHRTERRKPV